MSQINRSVVCRALAALSLGLVASVAQAGGLYIFEFGQPTMGASGAGAGALAEDASTVFFNPAGISFLDGPTSLASGFIIDSSAEFRQDTASSLVPPSVARADGSRPALNGGDAGSTAVGGAYFYARPVNDKWGWGVSLVSISGAALDYEDPADFAGRYWATEVELLTVNVTPALSYRVNNELSVGVALPMMFGRLDMDIGIPSPIAGVPEGLATIQNGEDIQATVSLSALWQAADKTRLGVNYIGKTEMSFESDLSLMLPAGVDPTNIASHVEFTFPQMVRTSLAQELTDNLTLLATVAWEDWSAFDDIALSTPAGGGTLPRNWDDTWHFGLGLRGETGGPWTWYTGVAYDTDPTRATDRTADMPIDEQWRFSGGATYSRSNGHDVGISVTYADYGSARIDNGGNRPVSGNPWTVNGDYSTNRIWFIGMNYGW